MKNLNKWLLWWIGIALGVAGAAALAVWFADPDHFVGKVATVLYAPGGVLYFLVGCSPHTDDCGPLFTIFLLFAFSGAAWATALVGIPWLLRNFKRRRSVSASR